MRATGWLTSLTAALALMACSGLAAAADFPVKTVRLVAPAPPGSPPDVVARLLAEPLARAFGQPVLVENRPGANQTIGLAAVAAAPADGHTLAMVSLPTAVMPSLMDSMPFDTLRDFAAVREVAWTFNVLVVRGDGPVKTIADLMQLAKERGGRLSFASGGNGTPAHVMGEMFRGRSGMAALHVPFKGAAEGVNAVIAGHVEFMLASAGAVIPHLRTGRLAALAQTSRTRLPTIPDVPTFGEAGFPEIVVRDWQGIVAPAGTPRAVLQRLSDAIGEAALRPEVRDKLRALAIEPAESSGPEPFAEFFASEVRRWGALARSAGIKAQ